MKTTTLKQGKKILEIFEDTPADQVQALFASGLLYDVRDANFASIDREVIRAALGLRPPLLPKFPIWRTLTIGGQSKEYLLTVVRAAGAQVQRDAMDMMNREQFTAFPELTVLNLVRVQVGDLGFTCHPTHRRLLDRVKEVGGLPCPAEVGPRLWMALVGHMAYNQFSILMDPITDPGYFERLFTREDAQRIFSIHYDGDNQAWLGTRCLRDDNDQWDSEDEIVFVLS